MSFDDDREQNFPAARKGGNSGDGGQGGFGGLNPAGLVKFGKTQGLLFGRARRC